MTGTVRFVKPQALQIAEYWNSNRARGVTPVPDGLGFDAEWGDQLRDHVRTAIGQLTGGQSASVDLDGVRGSLDTPQGFSAAWRVVTCLENHDLVKQGASPRIPALAHSSDSLNQNHVVPVGLPSLSGAVEEVAESRRKWGSLSA
jgi:1,4-alpha-glucan branching enzyme